MFLLISLSTLLLLFNATIAIALDEVKVNEDDMYQCTMYICCELRETEKLRDVTRQYGSKTKSYGWEVFESVTGMSNGEDTPEFFAKSQDELCPKDEEIKKTMFTEFIMKMRDYWNEMCEKGEFEECKKFDEGATAYSKILTEHVAKGNCGSSSKAKDATGGEEILAKG